MSTAPLRAAAAPIVPEPTPEELRWMYRVAARSRCAEEHIVRLVTRGEVKFAIWGVGEEVHGTATALALSKVVRDVRHFGIVPHYRSGSMVSAWCELHGVDDFTTRVMRQQFSRGTDAMSGGRQMVYHLHLPEVGVLPVQSPVGMQLGKAAGYALGFQKLGVTDGLAIAVVGDGTTAEGDMHDAMNAASVWRLPLIVLVTDNAVAISTLPGEGRGIRDFRAYAESFGFEHFSCDGRDFWDCYETTWRAASVAAGEQRPVLLHVRDLPRFNGHSSAADVTFDLSQDDPLIRFGEALTARGVLRDDERLVRRQGQGREFFAHHALGAIMAEEDERIRAIVDAVRAEPEPDAARLGEHMYPPFPARPETTPGPGQTNVTYAGAIRSALDKLIARRRGCALGQDIGRLGGVMTATAGLKARHPDAVTDAPLNEPLICGVATGLGLHPELMALPEVQFGDYSLNAFHWLVYWGTLHWSTLGNATTHLALRMPTDPFGGGAMYHSMSVEGYFSAIPGLVLCMPSTSFDAHGLLLTAGEYQGPVVFLEPKWMYRQNLGPAFPGEPTDAAEITALKKSIMRAEVPDLPDVYVPFGKAAVRRAGDDVTIVAWGRAVWTAMAAAERLAGDGVSCEVLDLRTLVPPDLDAVITSARRTGRLVVAAEDRAFAGFVRAIQGAAVEAIPGLPTVALGQQNLPAIAQSLHLEEHQVLTSEQIEAAVRAA
ncbi:MAG TPA: thiamine pyrophosphate-dependent enzyme, partial [Myxococcota bacterium]|nr:thiamine pyrophosphate-dependent enzyme [Myxococcota bacterium]